MIIENFASFLCYSFLTSINMTFFFPNAPPSIFSQRLLDFGFSCFVQAARFNNICQKLLRPRNVDRPFVESGASQCRALLFALPPRDGWPQRVVDAYYLRKGVALLSTGCLCLGGGRGGESCFLIVDVCKLVWRTAVWVPPSGRWLKRNPVRSMCH